MRTVNLLIVALIVAFTSAQNVTVGTSCASNHGLCAAANSAYCCANLVSVTWVRTNSTTATTTVCLNRTAITNGKANATNAAVNTTASCIVANSSFLVKMSLAVASLGFASLFL